MMKKRRHLLNAKVHGIIEREHKTQREREQERKTERERESEDIYRERVRIERERERIERERERNRETRTNPQTNKKTASEQATPKILWFLQFCVSVFKNYFQIP